MNASLSLARRIDALSAFAGRQVSWLVLVVVLVSSGNAVVRKLLNQSSNALLEMQWYLFAAIFMLAAGYVLLLQEHVKIDVVLGRFPRRTQVAVEMFGLAFFLLPFTATAIAMAWPLLATAFATGEVSSNAGGLVRWPVYALLPMGFALLAAQGVSELIKRAAFLRGLAPDPGIKGPGPSAEQALADDIRKHETGGRT